MRSDPIYKLQHDLANQMSIVSAYAGLLQQTGLDEEQSEIVSEVAMAAAQAVELLAQMVEAMHSGERLIGEDS